MLTVPSRGLPPGPSIALTLAFALIFGAGIWYFLHVAFRAADSTFGPSAPVAAPAGGNVSVGGGPPAAVSGALAELRRRIAKNPRDAGALTSLGELYLAANKPAQARTYLRRALAVDPANSRARRLYRQTGER